jgi:Fic family protein
MLLGEAQSKCAHISGVPLTSQVAEQLHKVYLAKGAWASTAIEGNSLTEEEVRRRLEGNLPLPESREYLGIEIDNIFKAINETLALGLNSDGQLTPAQILEMHRLILEGLPNLSEEVVPGAFRTIGVGVADYGAPSAQYVEFLVQRLCNWLNEPVFRDPHSDRIAFGILRAIIAHVYLAWIHPFSDGNGRTARLVEFKMLIEAGVPTPAAHLLSNHYNLTRTEYYRQLSYSSKSGGELHRFIEYSLVGFVDGLREQLDLIREHQWTIAWRSFVHARLPDEDGAVAIRRRHLVLDLTSLDEPVESDEIRDVSARVARDYAGVRDWTLRRDLIALVEMGLLIRADAGLIANKSAILAFLPFAKANLPTTPA